MQTNIQDDKGTLRWCYNRLYHVTIGMGHESYMTKCETLCGKVFISYSFEFTPYGLKSEEDCKECVELAKLIYEL